MRRVCFSVIVIMLALAGCAPLNPGGTPAPVGPTGTPVPPPLSGQAVDHPQLTSFHMLNELDGWGLTEKAVLRTNNGGTTWHSVTPPGDPFLGYGVGSSDPDAGRAAFVAPDQADPMNAGTLYITKDGGHSWTSNPVPFGGSQLSFFEDMQKGWALAGLGVAAGSNAIAVYQTADGGKTWEKQFTNLPTEADAREDIPMGGLKGVFAALDMQRAWVGGVVYSERTSYLYRTTDGGRHWQHVELAPPNDDPAQWSVESIQFVNEKTGFLTMQVTGQASYRAVYVTRDAGNNWELTPTLIPNGRAADFVSETDGFVFDGEKFQATHDAGQTWTAVDPDVVFSESFISMDFVNAQTGWVTASDPTTFEIRVYKTTDGGRTWLPQ